jgi:MFS superfamily sulfate permease-like transporter
VVVGPEGAVALLVASALAPLAAAGSSQYTALAAALAVAVGGVFALARLLRLGWVADYFSQSVLVGYITGVAVLMILSQLEKLTGVSSEFDNAARAAVDIISHLGDANPATLAVGGTALGILVLFERFLPRWPAALVVVVLGIVASWLFDLQSHGVAVAGSIPAGLPSLAKLDVTGSQMLSLAGPAVAIFLVSFSDSILTARSFAARHNETVDADQELLAFGVASVAAGFSQGMPIGTSGSRTAVNGFDGGYQSGQRFVQCRDHGGHPAVSHRPYPLPAPRGPGRCDCVRVAEAHRRRTVAGAGPQQPS